MLSAFIYFAFVFRASVPPTWTIVLRLEEVNLFVMKTISQLILSSDSLSSAVAFSTLDYIHLVATVCCKMEKFR